VSEVFQAIPFKLGDLRLVLVPKFSREDLEWIAAVRPDEQRTDKETGRMIYRILDLTFRCARDNSPVPFTMEDLFAEFAGDPKQYGAALATAFIQLACSILEKSENQCPTQIN
jgi:hypothetical protein